MDTLGQQFAMRVCYSSAVLSHIPNEISNLRQKEQGKAEWNLIVEDIMSYKRMSHDPEVTEVDVANSVSIG